MTKYIRSSWYVILGLLLVLSAAVFPAVACGAPSSEPVFTDDEAQLMVVARLIDMAQTPEAKEYIGLLFPSLALGDFVKHWENLGAWLYVVDYWPREAPEAFSNALWFDGDFDEHFSSFNRPTWVIYDDGRIVPQGGALLVEADIDKLNRDRILQTTQGSITVGLGQEFSLQIRESASIRGEELRVRFLEVTEDSRCPKGVVCVWEGRVSCLVEITYRESLHQVLLTEPGSTNSPPETSFEEYTISYHLEPYPEADTEIKDDEYQLVLVISKE